MLNKVSGIVKYKGIINCFFISGVYINFKYKVIFKCLNVVVV